MYSDEYIKYKDPSIIYLASPKIYTTLYWINLNCIFRVDWGLYRSLSYNI